MGKTNKVDAWHQTKLGHGTFGIVELAAAYGFASWAIDSGSLWGYLLTILFVVGGIHNLVRIFKSHGQRAKAK